MKRLERLITRSKRDTENEDQCSDSPITDDEFVDYLNDAQAQIQSAIARQHKNVFIAYADYNVVTNQDEYPMPEDALLDNRISTAWYTYTGRSRDFQRLRAGSLIERVFGRAIEPIMYIRASGNVILNPTPKKSVVNGLRVAYVKRLPELDIRRAKIDTVATVGNQITSLTLDVGADFQRDSLLEDDYFCVVNRSGDQVMKAIPYDNIDATTGLVTITAGFEFEDGETISDGDYLVRGKDTTNRSELADTCERYLVAYLNWKIFRRDSSSDSAEQTPELLAMQEEIVDIYKETDDDIKFPAIEDTQFIDDDELWNFF